MLSDLALSNPFQGDSALCRNPSRLLESTRKVIGSVFGPRISFDSCNNLFPL